MDDAEARGRFAAARVAHLATVRPDGAPHIVPLTFALDGDTVFSAVDAKPKRSQRLQRLANIEDEPRCTLLVDHYDDDWSQLWWVRADGLARVVEGDTAARGVALLTARYSSYAETPPAGPVLMVTVTRWRGWSAS